MTYLAWSCPATLSQASRSSLNPDAHGLPACLQTPCHTWRFKQSKYRPQLQSRSWHPTRPMNQWMSSGRGWLHMPTV